MDSNKLIAEFMGYEECPDKLFKMGDEFQSFKICSEYRDEDEYNTISAGARIIKFTPEQMEFHTSWDWLMPVVDKIEAPIKSGGYGNVVLIERNECTILSGGDGNIIVSIVTDKSRIENTYLAVIEFIKNYVLCLACNGLGCITSTNEIGDDELQRCDVCKVFKSDDDAKDFMISKLINENKILKNKIVKKG